MPNPMQRQNDRDGLKAYLERVAHWRKLVQLGEIDPALPTHHGPGSDGKMILLTLRDEMGLPLHVAGDNPDTDCEPYRGGPQHPISAKPVVRLMVSSPRVRSMRAA